MGDRDPQSIPPDGEFDRIAVYRQKDAGRVFPERTARLAEEVMFNVEGAIAAVDAAVSAGEMPARVAQELREIHVMVRQRALGMSPQGRLV
jgi:hypothetical protein